MTSPSFAAPRRWPRSALSCLLLAAGVLPLPLLAAGSDTPPRPHQAPLTLDDILAGSQPQEWEPLDPDDTLYLELPAGRVVIKLAPDFAPRHIANIKALARERYYDGLAIVRAQDNYVVQLNDPDAADERTRRPIHHAARTLPAEFSVDAAAIPFQPLPDPDVYAPQTGFSRGFAAARDPDQDQAWLTHCYAAVGVGRDLGIDSGGGPELYVVIGSAPRHLDRNVTLVGRVVQGIERLSTLPRGTGPYGMYTDPAQRTPIRALRLAADLPAAERTTLETLRTDSPSFARLIEARRRPPGDWFAYRAGRADICNIPIPARPIRAVPATAAP